MKLGAHEQNNLTKKWKINIGKIVKKCDIESYLKKHVYRVETQNVQLAKCKKLKSRNSKTKY